MKLSADKLGTLTVVPQTPTSLGDVPRRIQITDGTLSLVAKGFGQLEKVRLPAGVYQARVESMKEPFEQMVFVPPGQETSVTYPVHEHEVLPSAAPVPGTDAMHEYMRGPLDQVVTRPASKSKPCRILLMATQPLRGGPPIDLAGFRLLDRGGNEIGRMAADATSAPGNEWKMFSQEVEEGGWVLEGQASNFGRQAYVRHPVWCSRGWSTLIFIGANSVNGMPDLEKISIYFWRTGQSFAPEQQNRHSWTTNHIMESQRYTELALRSLVNGRSLLSMQEVDTNLLVEKFKNPMLGILGSHLLLQRTARDEQWIKTVLTNLDRLIPGDPDVIALEVMARHAGVKGLKGKPPTVSWPPMLRLGFQALLDEDWLKPGTIAPDSVCDRIRTKILSGGVWTRWIGEKDRTEFIARAASAAAPPKAAPAWRKLSDITGSLASTSRNLLSYAKQFVGPGGKTLQPDDLRWTGMSRPQATAALHWIKKEYVGRLRPQRRNKKTAAGISLKKVPAKRHGKTRSEKALRARALKARAKLSR